MAHVLDGETLVARYPRLYHMAEAGSWASIEKHGLLSTTALLDLFEVRDPLRFELESRRRPTSVSIHHPIHGTAWIRDNKPVIEKVLRRTLVGMTPDQWYRTLNARVFFWVSIARLERLRMAPPYRHRAHDILILDTSALVQRHMADVELAHLNTGATHPAANYPRGDGTFQSIGSYPWAVRQRVARAEPLVELTVLYAVPDVREIVVDVQAR